MCFKNRAVVGLLTLAVAVGSAACDEKSGDESGESTEEEASGGIQSSGGEVGPSLKGDIESRLDWLASSADDISAPLAELGDDEQSGVMALLEDSPPSEEIRKFLSERVLVASSLEMQTDTVAVYRVDAANFCVNDDGTIDEACVPQIQRLNARFRFSLVEGDGVTVEILVGAEQKVLLKVSAAPGSATFDLDAAVVPDVISALRKDGDEMDVVTGWSGHVVLELLSTGDHVRSVELRAPEGVVAKLKKGSEALGLSISPSASIAKAIFDGGEKRLTLDLGLEGAEIYVPFKSFFELAPEIDAPSELRFIAAKLKGHVEVDAVNQRITLAGMNIGESGWDVRFDGKTAVHLTAGSFDAVASGLKGEPTIVFANGLSIGLTLSLADIADVLELPAALVNETASMTFVAADGAAPMVTKGFIGGVEGIKIADGLLTLASSAAGKQVETTKNQCLLVKEPEGDIESWLDMVNISSCD